MKFALKTKLSNANPSVCWRLETPLRFSAAKTDNKGDGFQPSLSMTLSQRNSLAQRFNHACGYCGTTEIETGARLTVDHFQPTSYDGADAEENWVYCCFACNVFKHNYWSQEVDSALLRPLQDHFSQHYQQRDDGILAPLTQRGRVHIETLHLNRPQLVEKRRRQVAFHAERQRAQELETQRQQMEEMEEQVIKLTREIFGEEV